MIAVALGANLPSTAGAPRDTLRAALARFPGYGIRVKAVSKWYETAPVPASDQPWYVNGVVAVETDQSPEELLNTLLSIELLYGRKRGDANAARTLDLDIIDYEGRVEPGPPILPHPRLENRAFVLLPLRDIAPGWQHPTSHTDVETLISQLSGIDEIRRIS